MVVFLNGAFGIGKTVVARGLVARLPDSLLFDPEKVGLILQRGGRLAGRAIEDFQDLPLWRKLTVRCLRGARALRSNIVVPIALSNASYLREIRDGVSRFEPEVRHFCLIAPVETVHDRLRKRGADPSEPNGAWQYRRATECCAVHGDATFAEHVSTVGREPDEIARDLFDYLESFDR